MRLADRSVLFVTPTEGTHFTLTGATTISSLVAGALKAGTYRLVFDVAGYFKLRGVKLPEPNFLNRVTRRRGTSIVSNGQIAQNGTTTSH